MKPENFVIATPAWETLCEQEQNRLMRLLFAGESAVIVKPTTTIWDVLVDAGVFRSKSEARKNWKGPKRIPWGLWDERVGKMKHHIATFKME